jgi:hypothetical protein
MTTYVLNPMNTGSRDNSETEIDYSKYPFYGEKKDE